LSKLSSPELDQVCQAVTTFSQQLLSPAEVKPLLLDTGASASVSGFKDDFVKGTFTPLPTPVPFDGVGGTKFATRQGYAH
jgi:hypothetical protein